MDEVSIAKTIIDHWKRNHQARIAGLSEDRLQARAAEAARLARAEMQGLIRFGLDPHDAWQDVRKVHILAPPALG